MRKRSNLNGKLFVLALCAMFMGCDDTTTFVYSYTDVCETSGGRFENGKCFCGTAPEEECSSGVVCRTDDKTKCAEGKKQALNDAVLPCTELGKVLCADGSYQKCDGGMWSEIKTCSPVPNKKVACANNNACGVCYEDEMACRLDNGKYVQQQCKNGRWVTVKECGSFGCGADNACASQKCAIEGGKSCQNDMNKEGTLRECKGDATEITKCRGGKTEMDFVPFSCKPDNTCGECLNDTTRCENGILSTCKDGTWNTSPCPGEADCKNATACLACKTGATKCEGGQMYKCEFGEWNEPKACDNGASCKSDTECGECRSDTNVCTGGTEYKCINGILENPMSCKKDGMPVSCKNKSSCGECKDTDTKCEGNQLSTCTNGTWGTPSLCPDNSDCATASMCGACKKSTKSCNNGKLYNCDEGRWGEPTLCKDESGKEVSCKDAEACGECINGQRKCEDNVDDHVGAYKKCESGVWKTPMTCNDNASCKSDKECGECKNGSTKCENLADGKSQVSTCKDGVWEKSEECKNVSCNAEGTGCGECNDGIQNQCQNQGDSQKGVVRECRKGKWVESIQCGIHEVTGLKKSCCENEDCSMNMCGECNISKAFYCKDENSYQCVKGKEVLYSSSCNKGCDKSTGQCKI